MIKLFTSIAFMMFSVNCFSQIEGDVVDSKEKGLDSAVINAFDSTGRIVETVRSDKRGFYFFKDLHIGKYKIEAKAPGFQTAVFENVKVRIELSDTDKGGKDISASTRLDIILVQKKRSD